MKSKDKKSLWDLNVSELDKKARDIKFSLAEMNIGRYTKQSKNIREAKNLRRDLAVINTIKRLKELSI